MVELIGGLDARTIRANLESVRAQIAAARERAHDPQREVEILAATKYVACEDLPLLADAGIRLVGENRAQDRLAAAGVEQIRAVSACTICDERYFSHRREGQHAGRQAGIAWLS